MNEERTAVMLLFANGAIDTASKVTLSDVLVVSQIVVGIATALWFFRKAKGQKIDNDRKEQRNKK